jgi:hypothetical protein
MRYAPSLLGAGIDVCIEDYCNHRWCCCRVCICDDPIHDPVTADVSVSMDTDAADIHAFLDEHLILNARFHYISRKV